MTITVSNLSVTDGTRTYWAPDDVNVAIFSPDGTRLFGTTER